MAAGALALAASLAVAGKPETAGPVVAAVVGSGQDGARAPLGPLVSRAARAGAAYAVLPGVVKEGDLASGPAALGRLARRHRMGLAASVREPAGPDGTYRLVAVLWNREGRVVFRHTQVMPPGTGADGLVRGDASEPLESADDGERRLGVLAAADLRAGVPRLAARGAAVVLVTGAEPMAADAWRALCQELARTYRVELVVAAPSAAQSGIFRRDGSVVLPAAEDRLVTARLDASRHQRAALGLPSIPRPTTYESTPALVALGRDLFFDGRLSRGGGVSCAQCHQPERAFANGEATGAGTGGRRRVRNVPSLLNVAFRSSLLWDGGSASLEDQAKFPMSHTHEMDLPYLDTVALIRADPGYARRFRDLTGEEVTYDQVARALASYQRTLVSADSAFDRFQYGGDRSSLDEAARRGLALFTGKAACAGCHTIGPDSALFSDQQFHNTGVGYREGFPDIGRGMLTDASRSGFFLTPSLRNVALTAPYMHDGSLATLEDVVAFYDRGGTPNPNRDAALGPRGLTARERGDLVAFLRALTGTASFDARGLPADPPAAGTFQAAALDFRARAGQVEENRSRLAEAVASAAARGASLVVLPEHAQTGPLDEGDARHAALASRRDAASVFGALARRHRVWLTVPLVEADPPSGRDRLVTLLLDDQGRVVESSPKRTPRRELGDGATTGGEDHELRSVETPFGRVALVSGDDLAFALPKVAERGAGVVLVGASWRGSDGVEWVDLARELARQHHVTLVIANQGGPQDPPAVVIGPDGGLRATARSDAALAALPRGVARPPALGLPTIPTPSQRPATPQAVALGRRLFAEPRLSRDGRVSCASCHDPERSFADGVRLARGVYGRAGRLNTPTLLNAGYRPLFAWEGTASSLEEQIERALTGWAEMDGDLDRSVAVLRGDPEYVAAFRPFTGGRPVEPSDVTRALADYVRTLVSGDSPFDRYFYGGRQEALGAPARRGLALFQGRAGCGQCHTIGTGHALFTDMGRHNTGVGYQPRFEYLGYGGDGLADANLRNVFRGEYATPSLRNVARTAPYMHDGSLATLEEVVGFYNRGGVVNPFRDPRIRPLGLAPADELDLVAFLRELDGRPPDQAPARTAVDNRVH